MLEAWAVRISRYLVSIDAAKEEDRETVAYGLFRLLSNAVQYTILLAGAIIIKAVPEIALFMVMFVSLRRYAGGAHAENYWVCLCVTSLLPFVSYGLCSLVPAAASPYVACVLSAAALALVLLRAPVTHPNFPQTPKRMKQIRKTAVTIAIAQTVPVLAGSLLPIADLWILCGAAGGFACSVMLILPMPTVVKGGERS